MDTPAAPPKLACFPIGLFAMTMGLSGLAICTYHYMPETLMGPLLSFLALGVFVTYLTAFILKFIKYRSFVMDEWKHPVKISFFASIPITMLLLGGAFVPLHEGFSFLIWVIGTVLQFLISLSIINYWISQTHYEIANANPTWFIPVVGNIIVPVAGSSHVPHEICWFFFAWGLLFWGVLFSIVIYRLMFFPPLVERLIPTMFVMLAPPSIGFVSYISITGEIDLMARLLYYWSVLIFILLISRLPQFLKLQFTVSWWAYSFPMTAFCTANYYMGKMTETLFIQKLGEGLYILTCLIIASLFLKTLHSFAKGEIFKLG